MKKRKLIVYALISALVMQCMTLTAFAEEIDNEQEVVTEIADGSAAEEGALEQAEDVAMPEETEEMLGDSEEHVENKAESEEKLEEYIFVPSVIIGPTLPDPEFIIEGLEESYTYTGKAIKPAITVKARVWHWAFESTFDPTRPHIDVQEYYKEENKVEEIVTLQEGKHYKVTYKNNTNAGTASMTIKGAGNIVPSTISKKVTFEIEPADADDMITVSDMHINAIETKYGSFKAQKPVPTVTWKSTGKKVASSAYTIYYYDLKYDAEEVRDPRCGYRDFPSRVSAITKPGTYSVCVVLKGNNYSGDAVGTIQASNPALMMSKANVSLEYTKYTYTGSPIVPRYMLSIGGVILEEGKDFELESVKNNVEPGKATITFVGKGRMRGSVSATFNIVNGKDLSKTATIEMQDEYTYVKGGVSPAVVVKDGDKVLTRGTDYTVSYKNNNAVTTSKTKNKPTITITFKGKYKGTVKKTFSIKAAALSSMTISAKAGSNVKKNWKSYSLTIKDTNGKTLGASDYKVISSSFSLGDDPATPNKVTFTVRGTGCYTGDVTVSYTQKYWAGGTAATVEPK